MVRVSPEGNHRSPSKGKEEGDLTHTQERATRRKRQKLE